MFVKKIILVLVFILTSTSSFASYQFVGIVTIKSIQAYEDFGDGDIYIETSNGNYFINTGKLGGKNLLSIFLMALSSQLTLEIYYKNDSQWSGSGNQCFEIYCARVVASR